MGKQYGRAMWRGARLAPNVRQIMRLAIGLVIPFAVIDLAIPLTTRVDRTVLGAPFPVIWMFMSFIVAFACMLVTWLMFDRREDEDVPAGRDAASPEDCA